MSDATEAVSADYAIDVPSPAYVKEALPVVIEMWKGRNKFIEENRKHLEGKNEIAFPVNAQFKARITRTFLLQAAMAEKNARFMSEPNIVVVPSSFEPASRKESSDMEMAINTLFYEMEQQGNSGVWARMVADAISFDIGAERIEYASAPSWPEITIITNGKEKLSTMRPFESEEEYAKFREEYKRSQPVPLRSVYVPPDMVFPVYEGAAMVEVWEVEKRALREVLRSKMFAPTALSALRGRASSLTPRAMIKQEVTIVHYANQRIHAYYALSPSTERRSDATWPLVTSITDMVQGVGDPILLHYYEHDLGIPIYNIIGGREGGWKAGTNHIENVMHGMRELAQSADEIASQVTTNVRGSYWPTYVAEYDQALRGGDASPPDDIKAIPEGGIIPLWKGETLRPLVVPQPNPLVQWQFQMVVEQFERIAGSAAVYGQHQAGVATGFHQNLQITQAEHLDEKIEINLARGAVHRAVIVLKHIRQRGEKVWVHHRITNAAGERKGQFIPLDPKKLDPIPQLDAQVRKPRPIDYSVNIRAALDATMDRAGPGTPLLDDDTARERMLGEDRPDQIQQKIDIQNERRKLLASGVVSDRIAQALNLQLVKQSAPAVTDSMAAGVDPALTGAIMNQNVGGAAAAAGGVNPEQMAAVAAAAAANGTLVPPMAGPPGAVYNSEPKFNAVPPAPAPPQTGPSPFTGRGGGLPTGAPQPESVVGLALQRAARGGR